LIVAVKSPRLVALNAVRQVTVKVYGPVRVVNPAVLA